MPYRHLRNDKLFLYNPPSRNGKYRAEFSLENRLVSLNTKFQKKKGRESYGLTPTQMTQKH